MGGKRSLWSEIGISVFSFNVLIVGFLGILATAVTWIASPDKTIPVGWLWTLSIVSISIVWILFDALRRVHSYQPSLLPKVLLSMETNGISNNPLIIIEPSELFGFSSTVSLYYTNQQGIELEVGSGRVATIQTDRKIQVEILRWAIAHEDVLTRVKNGEQLALASLLVRPSVMLAANDEAFSTLGQSTDQYGTILDD